MNAFIDTPNGNFTPSTNPTLVLNNGKADIQADKPGWREGLKYIKSLYDEGLIDSSVFTQNADALLKLGDHAGGVILGSATVMHPNIFVTQGQKDGRDRQYDALPPLTGPEGKSYATYTSPSVPGATFVLTTKASPTQQIAAIMLGQARPRRRAQYNNTARFRDTQAVAKDTKSPDGYERRLFEATKLYARHESKSPPEFPLGEAWIDPARAGELATLQTNIGTFVQQSAVQFITGRKSLDSDWDSYLKNLDQLGLKRFLQIYQQAYDKTH